MAKDAKAEPDTADAVPKKKSKKLLIIVLILLVILLVLGGGVAFLIMKKNSANAEAEGAAPEHAVVEKAALPVYAAMDTFTVNLVGDQFLQLVLSVEVKDIHVDEALKTYSPKLRNNIMLLLSGKQAAELMTKEGKETLAKEIRDLMNAVLEPAAKPGEGPVKEVLFTSFIIQ